MNLKYILLLTAIILMGIFVIQNMEVVAINFLFWQVEASRVIIYLSIFLMGNISGWLGNTLHRLHR